MSRKARRWARRPGVATVALVLAAMAWPQAGSATEIASVPGTILDASPQRVLYVNEETPPKLQILDLASAETTTIPIPSGRSPSTGSGVAALIPGGAVFGTEATGPSSAEIEEWRDGALTSLGRLDAVDSIGVAGEYAIWSNGTDLYRRDLASGQTVTVSSDAGNWNNGVTAAGDVVYWDYAYSVRLWHDGVSSRISQQPDSSWATNPITDGVDAVYAVGPPCCGQGFDSGSIAFSDGSTETVLGSMLDQRPTRGWDYRASGGWIAFNAEPSSGGPYVTSTRSPSGTIDALRSGPAPVRMLGLNPSGQIVYEMEGASSDFLAAAGQPPFRLEGGRAASAFWADGHWYLVEGGRLLRVDTDTAVTSGPALQTSATDAEFRLASTAQDASYSCRLDQQDWAPCTATPEYSGLDEGSHTLSVASLDADTEEEDSSPAQFSWEIDQTAPQAPVLGTEPASPARDSHPLVTGAAEPGATVKLYRSDDCSGPPEAEGSASLLASGFAVVVGENSSTTFSATATDAAENTSACSAALEYREDSLAPEPPQIAATDPGSPANDDSPRLQGVAEEGSTVQIFQSRDCSGPESAGGSAEAFESTGIPVEVEDDRTTELSAVATDAAGNGSACSEPFSYTEVSTAPSPALSIASNPASTGDTVSFDASASTGLEITDYEWDLDGDGSFETDTGAVPFASRSYPVKGDVDVSVRVGNAVGLRAVAGASLSVRSRPPSGELGISIDEGARFTNDPAVTVRVVWPLFAESIALSNDGGFRGPTVLAVAPQVSWELDSSGPERLPKTVYARFRGGNSGRETYQDDIILDQIPPEILAARATPRDGASSSDARPRKARHAYVLTIRARDKTSGVMGMQVTGDRRKPGKLRRFRASSTVARGGGKLFVRVRDRAGNFSSWRGVRLK
jgi:hypothetical protein